MKCFLVDNETTEVKITFIFYFFQDDISCMTILIANTFINHRIINYSVRNCLKIEKDQEFWRFYFR